MRHLPVATMGAGVARPAIVAAVHPSAGLAGHAVALHRRSPSPRSSHHPAYDSRDHERPTDVRAPPSPAAAHATSTDPRST